MSKTARFLLTAFAVCVLTGAAAPALAAAPAPVPWESINLTFQPDPEQPMLLVSGDLPPGTKLPHKAELAVPAGTKVQWVGEILGGAATLDPTLEYVKSTVSGMDVYRFTLTKSRTAQIEGVVSGMGAFEGTTYASTFKWTAWQAIPRVGIMVRMPQGSEIVQAAPDAHVEAGGAGFSYYTKTFEKVKAGEVLDLDFSYASTAGAAAAGGATAAPTSNDGGLIIVLALLAVGVVLLAFAVWRKVAAKSYAAREEAQPVRAAVKTPQASVAAAPARGGKRPAKGAAKAAEAARPPKRKSMLVPTLVVVALFAVGAMAIAAVSTKAQVIDGKITKDFGAASPCTSASLQVVANDGVDLAAEGGKLVDAFKGQEGVGGVTLDIARSVVDVGFCESLQSEASVTKLLTDTGLVTVAAAQPGSAPASATVDAPVGE